jgi:hypothetical protein
MLSRSFLVERLPLAEFGRNLDRWKRLRRAGWSVTVLEDVERGELVALGWRNFAGAELELEPDSRGQFELPLDA